MFKVPATLQTQRIGDNCFIHDSLSGNMLKVSLDVLVIIETFKGGNSIAEIEKEYGIANLYAKLHPLLERGLLIESSEKQVDRYKAATTGNRHPWAIFYPFFIRFYTGFACTQKCDYCHITATCTTGNQRVTKMSWDTAKRALDEIAGLLNSLGKKEAVIRFYGGEPLLDYHVIEKILEYGRMIIPEFCDLRFTLNTNGTIFNTEIAEMLSGYKVDVHLSLDGITEAANRHRKLRSGRPALAAVLNNINRFLKYGIKFQINTTLSEANIDSLKQLIDFAERKGIGRIYLSFLNGKSSTTREPVMAQKVIDAYFYSLTKDVLFYGPWLFIFENLFKNNIFSANAEKCLSHIFIDPSGDFYMSPFPLEKVGYCGELSRLKDLAAYKRVKEKWRVEMMECSRCDIAAGCGMSCKFNVMYHTGTGEKYASECSLVKQIIKLLLSRGDIWKRTGQRLERPGVPVGSDRRKKSIWISRPGELGVRINEHMKNKAGKPLLVIACVPDRLLSLPGKDFPSQSLFMESVRQMSCRDCQILTTGPEKQFKTQCREGYEVLKNEGIIDSKKYVDITFLWHGFETQARNPERVAHGVIEYSKTHGGISFLLRPGSLRIGDSVTDIILASSPVEDILVIDTDSPIDGLRIKALNHWNDDSGSKYVYFNGKSFMELKDIDFDKIAKETCFVLYCLAEAYNVNRYASFFEAVIKKCSRYFGNNREVWLSWPGFSGKPVTLNDLQSEKLDKNEHYTIVIRPV